MQFGAKAALHWNGTLLNLQLEARFNPSPPLPPVCKQAVAKKVSVRAQSVLLSSRSLRLDWLHSSRFLSRQPGADSRQTGGTWVPNLAWAGSDSRGRLKFCSYKTHTTQDSQLCLLRSTNFGEILA